LPYGYRQALSDLHARWVGNGAIRGIWETEEGGNATHKADRHASIALRVFARSMSWAIDNAITPDQFRLFGSYKGPPGGWLEYQPREETSWGFAMGILHDFLGHSARLINRSAGATAVVDDPTENYAFETDDGRRRVVIVTPQSANWQGPTTVIAAGMAADGWTEPAVVANGHLFKSDAEGYATFPVAVVRNDATNRYELTLPSPIALNSNLDMQVLLITINRA